MKNWITRQWKKFKAWAYGLLIALGIVAAPLLYAEAVNFTYTPATQYTDGTVMPADQIAETRLYCDGVMVSSEAGADGGFIVDLGIGTHTCYGTHVATNGQESAPSNSVTKIVLPSAAPEPPVLDQPQ